MGCCSCPCGTCLQPELEVQRRAKSHSLCPQAKAEILLWFQCSAFLWMVVQ